MAKPPYPTKYARPVFGVLGRLRGDRLALIDDLVRDYGDVVEMPVPRRKLYLVADPDFIRPAITEVGKKMGRSSKSRAFFAAISGANVLSSEGDEWKLRRRIIQPSFSRTELAKLYPQIAESAAKFTAGIQTGEPTDIYPLLRQYTMDVIVNILFSVSDFDRACRVGDAVDRAQTIAIKSMGRLLRIPGLDRRKARLSASVQEIDEFVLPIVEARIARPNPRPQDLLDTLIAATAREGLSGKTQISFIRDQVNSLFIAGHETTANTLAFTLYLLGCNPDYQDKIAEEAATAGAPGYQSLMELRWPKAVLGEAMRLYPVIYFLTREAKETIRFKDYSFEKGTQFFISQWAIHRDERYWQRAHEFLPERFLDRMKNNGTVSGADNGTGLDLNPECFFPFGGGARRCVGDGLAMAEAALSLVKLCESYRWRVADGFELELKPRITLNPKNGIKLVFEKVAGN